MIQISVATSQMLKRQGLITIFENGIISTLCFRRLAYDVYLEQNTIYFMEYIVHGSKTQNDSK